MSRFPIGAGFDPGGDLEAVHGSPGQRFQDEDVERASSTARGSPTGTPYRFCIEWDEDFVVKQTVLSSRMTSAGLWISSLTLAPCLYHGRCRTRCLFASRPPTRSSSCSITAAPPARCASRPPEIRSSSATSIRTGARTADREPVSHCPAGTSARRDALTRRSRTRQRARRVLR